MGIAFVVFISLFGRVAGAQDSTGDPPSADEAAEDAGQQPDDDADDPVQDDPDGEEEPQAAGAGEIIVIGDLEVNQRRKEVIQNLRDLGYRTGQPKDGYTQFRPETPWKPTVRLYDDGFVVLKRSPVRFAAPGDPDKPLNYLWCIPPFTPVCVRVGGQMVSRRKLQHARERVVVGIEHDVREWREALVARAMDRRVGQELPDQLDALWEQGVPLDSDEQPIADPKQRRREILELWRTRTCTPEGEMVRDAIQLFLAYEVQTSPWPVTAQEAESVSEEHPCGARLELPAPP